MELSLMGVFLEGLMSFLSPCVLPLVPLFMAYLSGDGKSVDEDGNVRYDQKKVFISTFFFVVGISMTFVILGLSLSFIKDFIGDYQDIISVIGGTLIIIFGLHETGLITISVFNSEFSFRNKLDLSKMSFIKAFIFGFLFSFAWTPCIGPMLASVLLLSVSEGSLLYLFAYALGLIVPFLLTGLFTSYVLNFLKNKKHIFKYVMIIAGVIMMIYGTYSIYKASQNILAYKNADTYDANTISAKTFHDTKGNDVVFKDYRGKYIFLNFTATWCTYCNAEMPEYLQYAKDSEAVCFYVMSPLSENGGGTDAILKHVEDNNIDIPVIIDEDGTLLIQANVTGYPTLLVVGPDGSIVGYASGYLDYNGLTGVYDQAKIIFEGNK